MSYCSIKVSEEDVDKARKYASDKHKTQKYGDEPYIYHLDGVVRNTLMFLDHERNISPDLTRLCIVIAYLHDIVEDYKYTNTTLLDIEREFSRPIAVLVDLVTHAEGETYAEYLKRTTIAWASHVVKISDLRFNATMSQLTLLDKYSGYVNQRLEKYLVSLLYLEEKYDQTYR